ncbi:hypothetical protein B0H14DRAFT_3466435 [Mycena olivaceomarginata]|nr:hypothetical protein B0H14DRAFT_3466435 [Mycena olivaceomarginata]
MDGPDDDGSSLTSRLVRTNNRIRGQVKGPKPSTFGADLSNAMEKTRGTIKHIPKKHSLEDVIIESSHENIKLTRERADAQAEHRQQSLLVTQKAQLPEMLKLDAPTSTLIDMCRHAAIFGYLRLRRVDHGPSAPLIDVRLRRVDAQHLPVGYVGLPASTL